MPDGSKRRYAMFVPPQYDSDPSHRWPVIVALHGSGECGKGGVRPARIGLAPYVGRRATQFPFIVVVPQARTMWFRGADAAAVWAILESVHQAYRTDRDRVYLTGFSMGGYGTWELAMARPDVFAAIVPICGVGPGRFVSNIKDLPVWAFHGAKDPNVPVAGSREPIAALRRLGANPRYTEYANVGHKAWDRAYATPELWPWLLKQRRGPPPREIDYRFAGGRAQVWWLVAEADEHLKRAAHVRAEIGPSGNLTIQSSGVARLAVLSDAEPFEPGDAIRVTWNGRLVFEGEFQGGLMMARPPGESDNGQTPGQ